jgi:hypothetical protein
MSDLATVDDLDRVGKTVETAVMSMTSAVEAQTAAMERLAQAMTDQRHVESARASGGRAEIHVNAGSLALWLFATMGAVMLVCTLFLGGIVFWFAGRTSDQGHQMNAMYQSVPGLRELVNRQMELIDRTNKQQDQKP